MENPVDRLFYSQIGESMFQAFGLPRGSFIDVELRRLSKPKIVWINDGFSEMQALKFAFAVPRDNEPPALYLDETITGLADRYGGYGVGKNGGSARCAAFGGVQIKGSGPTDLLATEQDPWHRTGALTIYDGVREVIWSRICSKLLPHSAIESHALLLVGSTIENDPEASDSSLPDRALLLRDFPVRPAHLLRNVSYVTPASLSTRLLKDSLRVTHALQGLPELFRGLNLVDSSVTDAVEIVERGMIQVASRFAEQIAACFARRIFHRSLCCGNIALDGRFMDFGVMTSVDGFRRLAGTPEPAGPDQWNQSGAVRATLSLMAAHVCRYTPQYVGSALPSIVMETFDRKLAERNRIELLKLTGVPERHIKELNPTICLKLFRSMQEIYQRGARERYVMRKDTCGSVEGVPPFSITGAYDLSKLMRAAAQSAPEDLPTRARELINDTHLANQFSENYLNFMNAVNAEYRFDDEAREVAMAVNGNLDFLSRQVIDGMVGATGVVAEELNCYIAGVLEKVRPYVLAWNKVST